MYGAELDEEKLETLAHWAAGLRQDERPEVAAAGRAIELLIEEVERLHVLAWGKQLYPAADEELAETDGDADGDGAEPELEQSLRGRLALRLRRRHPQP